MEGAEATSGTAALPVTYPPSPPPPPPPVEAAGATSETAASPVTAATAAATATPAATPAARTALRFLFFSGEAETREIVETLVVVVVVVVMKGTLASSQEKDREVRHCLAAARSAALKY